MTRALLHHTRLFKAGACLLGILVVLTAIIALADKLATPPKPEKLVGVWIGFDSDELVFTRLDLRSDFSGYCARVSPADTILHEYGVHGYRITKWTVDGWKLVVSLSPADTNAEAIYLQGRMNGSSLRLEVGGTNTRWKREIVLYSESRIDASNQETRDKIKELENR